VNFSFFKVVFLMGLLSFFPFNMDLHAGGGAQVTSVKRNIPVVLSSDNNYAKYMYVAVYSMLENVSADTHYDIYIQISNDFEKKYRDAALKLTQKYPCTISFIEMDKHMPKILPGHLPSATYYRLFIPMLLPNLEKCIYIDSDILVLKCLRELYDIDMQDYYLAGVERGKPPHAAHLPRYVNAGVLLMNPKAMHEAKLTDTFVRMSEYGINGKDPYPYQDQDILNSACEGKIDAMDRKYNFSCGSQNAQKPEWLSRVVIFHFVGKKPWNDRNIVFADEWWAWAKKSPFGEEIEEDFRQKNKQTVQH
jgi:lipopolysaccharide biosynthesis glycosyltransferase